MADDLARGTGPKMGRWEIPRWSADAVVPLAWLIGLPGPIGSDLPQLAPVSRVRPVIESLEDPILRSAAHVPPNKPQANPARSSVPAGPPILQ